METSHIINLLFTFIAGMLGVAVGYGGLRNQVKTNAVNIKQLQAWRSAVEGNPGGDSAYMKRTECITQQAAIGKSMDEIKNELTKQVKHTTGLRNFARYMMTKDGLSLKEIEKIIEG